MEYVTVNVEDGISTIRVKHTVRVEPDTLAQIFWNYGSVGQAAFFNALGTLSNEYNRGIQWSAMADDLTKEGEAVIEHMAENVHTEPRLGGQLP